MVRNSQPHVRMLALWHRASAARGVHATRQPTCVTRGEHAAGSRCVCTLVWSQGHAGQDCQRNVNADWAGDGLSLHTHGGVCVRVWV